jgi:hypothetical protein
MTYECDRCGIAQCDIPDGVDPDDVFDYEAGELLCMGCRGGGTVFF